MILSIFAAFDAVSSSQLLSLAFLSVLFLQSGLDKVFNYSANLDWLQGHFERSPLKNQVGLMLSVITLLEVAAGLSCAIGFLLLLIEGSTALGLIGAQLSALAVLALFFGQRIAQDYEGAATLAVYFLISLASVYLMGLS